MTTIKNSKIILTMIIAVSSFLLPACKKTMLPSIPVEIPTNNIAYIYKDDSTSASLLKELLVEADCHVDLIDQAIATTKSYANYKLIIIDHNTAPSSIANSWTVANTTAITASGKPMLLLGAGGLQFAQKAGNKVNYGLANQTTATSFAPLDKTMSLYHVPYNISIPTSTPKVTLYASPSSVSAIALAPGTKIPEVNMLGYFPSMADQHPIGTENAMYTFFGFYDGVNKMTTDGKNFMVNLCYYAGNFNK